MVQWKDKNLSTYNFLDAALAVLGKQPAAYDHYAALIREEYQHVHHDTYCENRADILESFLGEVEMGMGVR